MPSGDVIQNPSDAIPDENKHTNKFKLGDQAEAKPTMLVDGEATYVQLIPSLLYIMSVLPIAITRFKLGE